MTDTLSKERRSWNMSRIQGKNTKPEVTLRSLLHRSGYRFKLHERLLPGRPDIVLPKYKTVIFVNGCFWHRHEGCSLAYTPASRTDRNWVDPGAVPMLGAYYCAMCGKQILAPIAALTAAEMAAQAERCACRGADDYCLCQNVPDSTTLANRSRNVSGNENGKELPNSGNSLPKRRAASA